MATLETAPVFIPSDSATIPGLLVSLASQSPDGLDITLTNLAQAFPGQTVMVASPDAAQEAASASNGVRLLPYTASAISSASWVLNAADYLHTFKLAKDHQATTCLLLGGDAHSLHPGAIRELALAAVRTDLAVARYETIPREGLVNSAILFPVTRGVFGAAPRFPLAIDLGMSLRLAERLAATAQRFTAVNQTDALIWPVSEAAAANYTIAEVEVGTRHLPAPDTSDLNSLLAHIAGSLFGEVEAKATFWQRARGTQSSTVTTHTIGGSMPDVQPMLDSFRIAYSNLHEIWSLVLPPNSLLGLKRLSIAPASSFRMAESLWARIVYDFILAYRLRTLNRGHLLGALTPLYLAWVASHLQLVQSGTATAETHIEAQAAAFEADKPYLVSRWRWPDRFNP